MRVGHGFVLAMVFTVGASAAQGQTASSADKDFLKDTVQDSNYEIESGRLALQKSSSADVKQYANMIIQDHTQLEQQEAAAEKAANTDAKPVLDMSVSDAASYSKLKLLSGDSFDQAYIKGLLKGNDEAVQKAKQEAQSSTVPAIQKLATHRAALDTKHAQRAKLLAEAHHISAGQ